MEKIQPLAKLIAFLSCTATLIAVLLPGSALAIPVVYEYTGNPFDTATAPFTTSDFVTATVTFDTDALLGDDTADQSEITSLVLNAGTLTLDTATWSIHGASYITLVGGVVQEWMLRIDGGVIGNLRTSYLPGGSPLSQVDDVFLFSGGDGVITSSPGTWAPVPEPTTMVLFGAGLIGLAGARRRINT